MQQELSYLLTASSLLNIIPKQVEAKTASTNLTCTLFICFVLDDSLQFICFRMFCSKSSITFENTYLLSYWFHCVNIFYIQFRFSKTFTGMKTLTKILLIGTL